MFLFLESPVFVREKKEKRIKLSQAIGIIIIIKWGKVSHSNVGIIIFHLGLENFFPLFLFHILSILGPIGFVFLFVSHRFCTRGFDIV